MFSFVDEANKLLIIEFHGSASVIIFCAKNNTQTAMANMTAKRMLENKILFSNLTAVMFWHTTAEVKVYNRSNN